MTISVLLDPAQMPDQSQDQLDFDNKMSGLMRDLPKFAAELNATEAAVSSFAAGGAYAFPYVFDNATADADPGAGKLRLSSSTQNTATALRVDALAFGGGNMMGIFDMLSVVTSVIKGGIRLVKAGDVTKWLLFDVIGVSSGTGYRNLAVVHRAGSSASPFAKDDALMVYIDRNGDAGTQQGMTQLLAQMNVGTPAASIVLPDIFLSIYDWYLMDIQLTSSNDINIATRFYSGGALLSGSAYFGGPTRIGSVQSAGSNFTLGETNGAFTSGILQLKSKTLIWDGCSVTSTGSRYASSQRGSIAGSEVLSGVGFFAQSSGTVTGSVRIYGVGK